MESRESQVRTWSMLVHLGALACLLFPAGLVLGPLILWQIKKNELPEIDKHGKEAVNFQLTVFILNIVIGIILIGTFGFGFFWRSPFFFMGGGFGLGMLLWLVNLAAIILAVIAGIRANNGEFYRYPFSIKFIR
jgi:uncharacterized Tic20 family protein